jgi:hypothetical protein
MLITIGVLAVTALLAAAALVGALTDTHLTRNDQDQKDAYYAAQAGIEEYSFLLNQDVNYWTYCVPTPAGAINQAGSTANYKYVPGSTTLKYAIQLLPATNSNPPGATQCLTSNPIGTMIEDAGPAVNTFRVRSTGFAGNVQRSVVATFRRTSFIDFVYYTVYETSDPVTYPTSWQAGAQSQCSQFYRNGRESQPIPGSGGTYCSTIYFKSGDVVNGPFHTEDQLAICGNPSFGRGPQDNVEVGAPAPGHSNEGNGSCSDNPTFLGNYITSARSIQPPPSNSQLLNITQPAYHFTGQNEIVLNSNGTITVTPYGGSPTTLSYPSNGVIYVSSNSGCSKVYDPFNVNYSANTTCGDAYVHGTATAPLTIGTDDDIIVDGNIISTSGGLLGLVAQNFVRVYHPFPSHTQNNCGSGTNGSGTITNLEIDAAILSISHSFIVDNYDCGAALGTLTVKGAIAQIYRGPVGTVGSPGTGYTKAYQYDDRLRAEEPPHFISPVQAAWHVVRETEDNP